MVLQVGNKYFYRSASKLLANNYPNKLVHYDKSTFFH